MDSTAQSQNKVKTLIKTKIVPYFIVSASFFAIGYFSRPPRVEIKEKEKIVEVEKVVQVEKIVEVEKLVTSDKKNEKTFKKKVNIVKPDGTNVSIVSEGTSQTEEKVVTKIEYVDRVVEKVVEKEKIVEKEKTVKSVSPEWMITPMVGFDMGPLSNSPSSSYSLVGGGSVEKRIIGPFWGGIWGLSNGMVGVSISMEF